MSTSWMLRHSNGFWSFINGNYNIDWNKMDPRVVGKQLTTEHHAFKSPRQETSKNK